MITPGKIKICLFWWSWRWHRCFITYLGKLCCYIYVLIFEPFLGIVFDVGRSTCCRPIYIFSAINLPVAPILCDALTSVLAPYTVITASRHFYLIIEVFFIYTSPLPFHFIVAANQIIRPRYAKLIQSVLLKKVPSLIKRMRESADRHS